MTELSDICGLPIFLDEETGEISYGDEVVCFESKEIELNEIVPVLLNRDLRYPEQIYKHFRNVVHSRDTSTLPQNVSYSIIKIPQGLLGIEYIKTHIYYSEYKKGKHSSVIEVIAGSLTVILQRNSELQDEYAVSKEVEEVIVITLNKGERLAIPTGYFYTFVNAGTTAVVFAFVTSNNHEQVDYTQLQREKGLACYIISKNAKIEVVTNPKYRIISKLKKRTWKNLEDDLKEKFNLTNSDRPLEGPLYDIFKEQSEILEEVLA